MKRKQPRPEPTRDELESLYQRTGLYRLGLPLDRALEKGAVRKALEEAVYTEKHIAACSRSRIEGNGT